MTERISTFLCATLFFAGCGAGGSMVGSTAPLIIRPTGPQPGALVVQVPSAAPATDWMPTVYKADNIAAGATNLTLGTPVQLDADTYCIVWNGVTDCSLQVVAGQTTTYTLAVLNLIVDQAKLTTDLGKLVTQVVRVGTNQQAWAGNEAANSIIVLPGSYVGSYVASLPLPEGVPLPPTQAITVSQGEVVDWPWQIPEWRFAVHLIAPERELPDVVALVVPYSIALLNNVETFALPTDRVLLLPPANAAGYSYTLAVFGVPLQIPAGPASTQTDVTISRLDVADVTYPRPDGTTATVPGRWNATRTAGAPGPLTDTVLSLNADYPTNHGIDVIEGTYMGTVTYDEQDLGGPGAFSFSATF